MCFHVSYLYRNKIWNDFFHTRFSCKKISIMFKHPAILLAYSKYSVLPSILASIPMVFFVRDARFTETWLLYLGDAFFLFSMIVVMLILSKTANNNAGTGSMMIAGHAITI